MRVFSGRDENKRLLGDLHCILSLELVVASVVCFLWEMTVGHKSLAWQTVPCGSEYTMVFDVTDWLQNFFVGVRKLLVAWACGLNELISQARANHTPSQPISCTVPTFGSCFVDQRSWFMFSTMLAGDILPPRGVKRTSIIIHNHEISQRYTCTRCKHLHDDLTLPFLKN